MRFGSILSSFIHQRVNCKTIFMLSNLLAAVSICWLDLALDVFLWLCFILFLLGISVGLSKAIYYLELMSFKTRYNRSNLAATSRFMLNLSVGVSSSIAGYLVNNYFYLLTYLAAFFSIIAIILYSLVEEQTRPIDDNKKNKQQPIYGLIRNNRIAALMLMLGITFFISFIYGFYPSVYMLFIKQQGFNNILVGYLLLMHISMIMIIEMPLVAFLNRFKKSMVCLYGSLAITVGFGILFFSQAQIIIFISLTLWTMGEMVQFSIFYVWFMEKCSASSKARLSGVYFSIYSFCGLIYLLLCWIPLVIWMEKYLH